MHSSLFLLLLLVLFSLTNALPSYCGAAPGLAKPLLHSPDGDGPVLRQAHVFIRSGDRSIVTASPCWINDQAEYLTDMATLSRPNLEPSENEQPVEQVFQELFLLGRNYFPGNQILSSLSPQGYKQLMSLGQLLQEEYVNTSFLSSKLSAPEVYVRALDVPQCIHSAQALLDGLYPVQNVDGETASLFDINTMDEIMDDLYPNEKLCPILKKYYNESYYTPEAQAHYQDVTLPLLNELAPLVGQKAKDIDLEHLFDCLNVHLCQNQPVPQQLQDLYNNVYSENLYYANNSLNYPSTQNLTRSASGFLLNEVYQYMMNIVYRTTQDPKLVLWSGEDATLMPLLNGLGLWDGTWTPYASYFQIELYEDTSAPSDWAVRFSYNGNVVLLPGCSSQLCDWSIVSLAFINLIPEVPSVECAK